MRIKTVTGLLLLLLTLALCKKETDNYQSKGTIIGPDLRDCACCGGWLIKIDTTEYSFDSLPGDTDVDLQKDTFPIKVKLDWHLSDKPPCPNKWIIITRIKKE